MYPTKYRTVTFQLGVSRVKRVEREVPPSAWKSRRQFLDFIFTRPPRVYAAFYTFRESRFALTTLRVQVSRRANFNSRGKLKQRPSAIFQRVTANYFNTVQTSFKEIVIEADK